MFPNSFHLVFLVAAATIDVVQSLDSYQLHSDGSCSRIQAIAARNIDRVALAKMKHFVMGSRYFLLRNAFSHPRYNALTEEDLLDSACLQRNTSYANRLSIATLQGFGQVLGTFHVRTPAPGEKTDYFIEGVSINPSGAFDIVKQIITLTDNKEFAFTLNCYTGSDQMTYAVVSRKRQLSPQAKHMIQEHVRILGFNPANSIFLTNKNCQDDDMDDKRHARVPPQVRQQRLQSIRGLDKSTGSVGQGSLSGSRSRSAELRRPDLGNSNTSGGNNQEGSGWGQPKSE